MRGIAVLFALPLTGERRSGLDSQEARVDFPCGTERDRRTRGAPTSRRTTRAADRDLTFGTVRPLRWRRLVLREGVQARLFEELARLLALDSTGRNSAQELEKLPRAYERNSGVRRVVGPVHVLARGIQRRTLARLVQV